MLLGINQIVEKLAREIIEVSSPTNSRIVSQAPTQIGQDFSGFSAKLIQKSSTTSIPNVKNSAKTDASGTSTKKNMIKMEKEDQILKI